MFKNSYLVTIMSPGWVAMLVGESAASFLSIVKAIYARMEYAML